MNKKELFLKYIDEQTSPKEKLQIELMLSENEANKKLFEKIKATRSEVLQKLELLNPDEPFIVPPFENNLTDSKKNKVNRIRLWHYAAMVAILIGIYFGLKLLNDNTEDQIVEVIPEDVEDSRTIYQELDCYISPNRCWNQKQLALTFIEINH